jgi:hypothetical protein
MSLTQILFFAGLGLAYQPLARRRGREWLLLPASLLALYALQPATLIRHLDFWLPTAARPGRLTWCATTAENAPPASYVTRRRCVLSSFSPHPLSRPVLRLTPRPPGPAAVCAALALLAVGGLRPEVCSRRVFVVYSPFLIALFVISPELLARGPARCCAPVRSNSPRQPADLRWLGFSYIAFRLLHILLWTATGFRP